MPSVANITPRLIYKEDLARTTTPGTAESATVAGLGTVSLTKIDALFLSDLIAATDDAGAALLGVAIGYPYFNQTTQKMKIRMV